MAQAEAFTSTGRPGEAEARSFGRYYQTALLPINELPELMQKFDGLRQSSNGYRRLVFRGLVSRNVFEQSIKAGLPVEAAIPMDIVNGHDDMIVFLAENSHPSPPQGNDITALVDNRNNHKPPMEKISAIIGKGYRLTKKLKESDQENLFALWNRFGWSREGIVDFIRKIEAGHNNLWFSGIRNAAGEIIAASQAEAIEFAGIKYIETTEYSTLDGFEGQGLCTASVSGLIAQLLAETEYSASNNGNLTVIAAEFNTSSTSAAVGASAGIIVPEVQGVDQILKYNVGVVDGAGSNGIFESEADENGIPFRFLRNFAVAVLPKENIASYYSPQQVETVINLFDRQ